MVQAFVQAGVPRQAIAIYPSPAPEVGAAVLNHCPRSLIFGSTATVERYKGNPRVQVHGPGSARSSSVMTRSIGGSSTWT